MFHPMFFVGSEINILFELFFFCDGDSSCINLYQLKGFCTLRASLHLMSFLVEVHWQHFGPKHLILAGQIPQESKNWDIGGILAIFGGKKPAAAGFWQLSAKNRQFSPKIAKMPPISQFLDSWGIWPANIKCFGPKCRQWTWTKKDIKCRLDWFSVSNVI